MMAFLQAARKSACRGVLLLGLLPAGCVRYVRVPLDPATVEARLAPPAMERVRVLAREIEHPLLKPVEIDDRGGLTPDAAAIVAVITNPILRAARDQSAVAHAQLLQTGILPNPTFSGSLDIPSAGSPPGLVNAFGLALDYGLRRLLLRGPDLEAARAQVASVDLGIAWQEWQVAQAARLQVYRIDSVERQLEVARGEETELGKNLDAVKRAVELRDMTLIDLGAADAAFQRSRTTVRDLERLHEQERLTLNETLGFPPDQTVPLRAGIAPPVSGSFPPAALLLERLEQRRLDLLAFRKGYESQEARLRSAVRGQFPRIHLGISTARDTGNVKTRGYAIALDLPVFDRNQGAIAIENATRQQLFDEYMARVFQVRAEVARILAQVSSIRRQIEVNEAAVRTLRQLVEVSRSGMLEGNVDVLSYYNTRKDLVALEIERLRLQQDLVDFAIALEIATGEYGLVIPPLETAQ